MSYRHPIQPEKNPQVRTLSGSSTQSAAVASDTKVVRLVSDVDCWVAFGASPTATTSSVYLPAKVSQVFGIAGGWKVAAIAGGAGNLYITEGPAS